MTTLLFGYFDLNFGDDWLIHEFINQYHKDNVILVVSDENLYLPFKHDIRFRKVSDLGKIKAFLQSDEICIVGGSMFQDSKHWFSHYLKLYIYLLIARILGKKNYVIGCNLNAIKNKKLNMLLKLLYKQVDHFRVRDSNSVKILNKDYNINEALISVKTDLADKSKLSLTVTKENSCAVSIINNKNTDKKKYYDWLTSNFKELRRKGIYHFKLFGFDSGAESDEKSINDFLVLKRHLFADCTFTIIIYNGNVDEFIMKWSTSKYALCTRFHSYILARNCKQNFRVFCYSNKIVEYIKTHSPFEMEYVDVA